MKKSGISESEPKYPLLVWDFGPNERILLKTFFLRCIERQIEVRPLTSLLSTLSANNLVALTNLVSSEPKLFSIADASLRARALEEIQASMSHISSANLTITECLSLFREADRERSSSSPSNGDSPNPK
jgi:hypothetical protein